MKTKIVSGWLSLTNWFNTVFGGAEDAAWSGTTAVDVGTVIIDSGKVIRAIVGGTTGSSKPIWPASINGTVVDGSVTWKYICNSDSPGWTATTVTAAGKIIFVTGNKAMRAIVGGTTDSSEPSWPSTIRGTVTDGTVTWEYFGGHQHDGLAIDGSSSKVLLTGAAEVSGTLPVANQDEHYHSADSGQFGKINPITHILGATSGVFSLVFPNTVFSTEQTVSVFWRKDTNILSGTGYPSVVTLSVSALLATSNATTFAASGTPLYESGVRDLRPLADLAIPILVQNVTNLSSGILILESDGSVALNLLCTDSGDAQASIILHSGLWTNSGNKGFPAFTVQYPIFPAP